MDPKLKQNVDLQMYQVYRWWNEKCTWHVEELKIYRNIRVSKYSYIQCHKIDQ